MNRYQDCLAQAERDLDRVAIDIQYEYVDVAILVEMVNHRLTDFERFRAEVLAYVQR